MGAESALAPRRGTNFSCWKCGELAGFGWRELAVDIVARRLGGHSDGLTGCGWKCKKCGETNLLMGTPPEWESPAAALADRMMALLETAEPVFSAEPCARCGGPETEGRPFRWAATPGAGDRPVHVLCPGQSTLALG